MRVIKNWARSLFVLLALSVPAHAETTVSQANDPSAAIDSRFAGALGAERAALGAIGPDRLGKALVEPKVAAAGKADMTGDFLNAAWIEDQPVAKGDAQWQCLTEALYFEARGEGLRGQVAVAEVILNRVDAPAFPKSICGVVNQSNDKGCQFSYTCDGKPEAIGDRAAYALAGRIARAMIDGAPRQLTGGATHFHTPKVRPDWSNRFAQTATIGSHIFYRAG